MKKIHYRPDIDGLRAISVIAVVMFHAFPESIRGGFIGVDIFFVISGYLISNIIFDGLRQESFGFINFYSRRIKRIFPALILVLLSCIAGGWFLLTADEYSLLGKHITWGAGFFSNFLLLNEAGYFDVSGDQKPLLHLWSLGIEEQYYLIWPLILWMLWKLKAPFIACMTILLIISFLLNIKEANQNIEAAFFMPQTRFWEFLCGSLLAWIHTTIQQIKIQTLEKVIRKKISWPSKVFYNLFSIGGICLLAYGFLTIDKEVRYPGAWALIPVLGALLVIAATPKAWINNKLLSNKFMVWLGLISFPLYLWHWPILSFARIIEGNTPSFEIKIALISLSVVLAWVTYRYIENPIRKGLKITPISAYLFIIMFFIAAGGLLINHDGVPSRAIAIKSKDFNYKTEVAGYKKCDVEGLISNDFALNYCLYDPNKTPNSAIIGDSHAEDKFHGLVQVDNMNNWMLIGNSSCPPVLDINIISEEKDCKEKMGLIFSYLLENKNIKNVVLSFYGNYFKTDLYVAGNLQKRTGPNEIVISSNIYSGSRKEIFYLGLDSAVKRLISNGKDVTLFIDIPELPFAPKDCYRNSYDNNCKISKKEVLERQSELRALLERLKTSNPKLTIYDPIELFCKEEICSYVTENIIMYRDSHHLSLRGSDLYAKKYINK